MTAKPQEHVSTVVAARWPRRRAAALGIALVLGLFAYGLGPARAEESTDSPSAPVASAPPAPPDRAHLSLLAGTDFPVDISLGLSSEFFGRLRLSSSLGFLPSPYIDAINSAMLSLDAYSQSTADLIRGAIQSSLVWRTHLGVFPFRSLGLYFDIGYGLVTLGGGTTAETLLSASTGVALPSTGLMARDFDVHATLHMLDVELGWRINIGEHIVIRPSIGGAFTVANQTSVAPSSRMDLPPELVAAFCSRSAAYLHDTLAKYVQVPVASLYVGYRFF
jgi:hypothetical protein